MKFIVMYCFVLMSCSHVQILEKQNTAYGFVEQFLTLETDQAHAFFNEELKKKMSKQALKEIQNDIQKKHGKFVRVISDFSIKDKTLITAEMEKTNIVIRVVLGGKKSVSGFWLDYQENKADRDKLIIINSFDGFKLPVLISRSKGVSDNDVKNIVIFIHGSGPNDYNGTGEKLFYYISQGLVANKIATIRYNKRSYEIRRNVLLDPRYTKIDEYKKFDKKPYYHFVQDANHMVSYAKEKFPQAKIILLGHSQGTSVALQVAHVNKLVEGTLLVGFSTTPIYVSAFEQYLYRPLGIFNKLDINNDEILSKKEILKDKGLLSQMSVIDFNKDGRLTVQEFKGAQYSNFVLNNNSVLEELTVEELSMPSVVEILRGSKFKVLFFQGEKDHQTQVYHTKAIQFANSLKWKKDNFKFVYMKNLGHSLNKQKNFLEFDYKKIDKKTVAKLIDELRFLTK